MSVSNQNENIARVQSIESCGAVDGFGLRYVVFLQGCQFKCRYCHNRDTWNMAEGRAMSIDDMMHDIRSYMHFYRPNRGGVTVSGGEATLQMPFVINLFRQVKALGLTTCLDTNGCILRYDDQLEEMLKNTDLVMLDIKHMDEEQHKKLTGMTNRHTLKFAKYLSSKNITMWIRYVVVPGWSDQESNVRALGEFVRDSLGPAVQYVDILPYHELGKYKWAQYGEEYELENVQPPSKEELERIRAILNSEYGLATR
ncbi:MAG: pyruvate formate lyase-activating protein [Succinivibrionaceae bacterium]|nr:pyruvate formate lyase-activating protein [Succinivibrionaceae bacterium]